MSATDPDHPPQDPAPSQSTTALSRKEKKAQRDAERRQNKGDKGSKKRKIAAVEDDGVTEENGQFAPDGGVALAQKGGDVAGDGVSAKESRAERRKRKSLDGTGDAAAAAEGVAAAPAAAAKATPVKRRKKNNGAATAPAGSEAADGAVDGETATTAKPTKSRFILFIGNLPFKTTDASLQTHFSKLAPFNLRHRTDPKTKKSKGFAFLEFENYDRMKTCLKLYHHSIFDPDNVSANGPVMEEDVSAFGGNGRGREGKKGSGTMSKTARRINVELTAGGGGAKAEGRKEKIKVKNARLEEQRKRRAEVERKEKLRKERKEGGAGGGGGGASKNAEKVQEAAAEEAPEMSGMHPARLARLNG